MTLKFAPGKKAVYDFEISKRSVPRPRSYNFAQPLGTGSLRTGPSSLFDEIEQFFSMFEDFWDWRPEFFGEWEEEHTDLPSLEIILTPSEARNGCEVRLEIPFLADCSGCLGSGFKEGFICGLCRGRGKERIQKKIRIIIPSGVKNGMQIRVPLKGRKLRGVGLIATIRVSQ